MRRPASVTVFGVLNIVFAVLGLLVSLFGAAVLAVAPTRAGELLVSHSHVCRVWQVASLQLGFVAACVLVAAGIGLLKMKRWARVATVVYAIYALAMGLVEITLSLVVVLPAAVEAPSGHGAAVGALVFLIALVGVIVVRVLALVYPVLLLIFMTRPRIVESFRASGGLPPSSL